MALYASGVQIPADLSGAISGVGSPGYNAYNQINSNYAGAKKKLGADASTLGMNPDAFTGPNSYAGSRLATGRGLDTGNLETALGTGLGKTGYQNTLAQRDFGQQEQIANEIAQLNRPDLLSQVLGGIGQVGGTAAQVYGAFGKNANSSVPPGGDYASYGSGANPFGYDPSRLHGYTPYNYRQNWGGGY